MKIDEYLAIAKNFCALNDFESALRVLEEASVYYASDYRVWMLFVKATTKNYTKVFDKKHETYLQRALAVADDEEIKKIQEEYSLFQENYKKTTQKEQQDNQDYSFAVWGISILIIIILTIIMLTAN